MIYPNKDISKKRYIQKIIHTKNQCRGKMDSHVDMTVHDKNVHDMTVHDMTAHDMTVHDKNVHDMTVHNETVPKWRRRS